MSRTYKSYLRDMLNAMNKIAAYTQGIDSQSFKNNVLLIDAV